MDKPVTPDIDNELFRLSVEQSKEGVAIHDAMNIYTYVNPAMASMFGYEPANLIGKKWDLLLDKDQINEIESEYLPILEKEGHWHGLLQGRRKNGDLLDIDAYLTVLKDKSGNSAGLVCRLQDLSESKRIQTELLKQRQQFQLVLDHSPILIAHVGADNKYKFVNKEYCKWKGVTQDSVGKHVKDVMTDNAYGFAKPYIDLALSGQEVNFEVQVPNADKVLRWLNVTYVPNKNIEGNTTGFHAFLIDVDDRRKEELERQNLMNAIDHGIEGFSLHDEDGNFTYVNPAEADMYGYQPEELIGKNWKLFYDQEQIKDIEQIYFPQLIKNGHWRGELKGLKKNGDYFDVEIALNAVIDDKGSNIGLFCSCLDITERKRSQEQVDYLAYHDSLTDLPNRLLFKGRLEQAIIRAERRNEMIAVIFIDLDYFKHVNDTLGHTIGDQLLQAVSSKLKSVFRQEDTISRLSGDEFTVLLNDITNKQSVEKIIDKLLTSFSTPININNREIHQGISVGISLYPEDGIDVETLMKNADAAMYSVKEQGRQGYMFYNPSISQSAYEKLHYHGELQNALKKDEFEIYYQPLISLIKNKIIGFEALLRWNHPTEGLVYPDKFIRYAEELNLISPIGYWVIENVCQQLKEWNAVGLSIEYIAVNVSGVQLQSNFAETVSQILEKSKTPAEFLDLEITETFLMKGLKIPLEQLKQLRNSDINLSIDDFGVGYSSLSQLKQLPINNLKIDRSFIGDIVHDLDGLAIVEAVIAMGKKLKLNITAEGVETAEQFRLLKTMRCDIAQGYHFSKPVPSKDIPVIYKQINEYLNSKI